MLEVTSDYIKAIENPLRVFEAGFGLNGKTYTKAKIASATYDSSISNSNDFAIGGGYINSLEIEIKEIIEGLQEMMPATMSVAISGKVVPLGRFFVTEVKLDRNDKKTKIKLLDEFARLGGIYDSTLKYPAFARDVFKEIVQLTGISVETNIQLINDQVAAKLEKTSYREALIYLAQLSGSFVRFNRSGKLDFIKLKATSRHITKDMYKPGGLERDELPYRLKGIECESADKVIYKSGLSTGNVMKLKNPWMTQAILDRIFNEYRDFNFYPYTLSWRGDMAMEAGDWVTVHWDDNIYFDIPMLSYKLSFDGGLSADSSGSAAGVAQGSYQYKGAMQRQIEYLDELITKQGSMYLDTSSPISPKDGDIWFKPNGGYVEMWERVEGAWIKKADSANVGEIVDTISTDELLAKKVSAAIGNYITLNAKSITAGDLDLARLRIMNGLKEIVSVRDGKVVMNIDKLTINAQDVATKADLAEIELKPGPKGDNGTSVTVSKVEYQAGTSATVAPTGAWSTSVVTVHDGQYLWTKTTFSDGKTAFTVAKQGEKGDTGTFDDDLSVENLLRGTKDMIKKGNTHKDDWYTEGAVLVDEIVDGYPFTFKKWSSGAKTSPSIEITVKSGVEYTFTAYIARENAGRLYFYLYDTWDYHITSATRRETIIESVGPEIQRFKITFVPTRDGKIRPRFAMSPSDQGWFMAGGYKLNRGLISSDWSLAPEDIDQAIHSKADQELTQAQLQALAETAQRLEKETEAMATAAEMKEIMRLYTEYKEAYDSDKSTAETKLKETVERASAIEKKLGELAESWVFNENMMKADNSGITFSALDGSESIQIAKNRITMFSAGSEVMSISQGLLKINNGIFSESIQIGHFREEAYYVNGIDQKMNVERYFEKLIGG